MFHWRVSLQGIAPQLWFYSVGLYWRPLRWHLISTKNGNNKGIVLLQVTHTKCLMTHNCFSVTVICIQICIYHFVWCVYLLSITQLCSVGQITLYLVYVYIHVNKSDFNSVLFSCCIPSLGLGNLNVFIFFLPRTPNLKKDRWGTLYYICAKISCIFNCANNYVWLA